MTDARRKGAAQNADLLVFLQLLTGRLTFPTGREGIREIRRTSDGWCSRCTDVMVLLKLNGAECQTADVTSKAVHSLCVAAGS